MGADAQDRRALVSDAVGRLAEAGVASPEFDAAELLAHVLGTSRSRLALVDSVPGRGGPSGTPSWSPGAPPASRCST